MLAARRTRRSCCPLRPSSAITGLICSDNSAALRRALAQSQPSLPASGAARFLSCRDRTLLLVVPSTRLIRISIILCTANQANHLLSPPALLLKADHHSFSPPTTPTIQLVSPVQRSANRALLCFRSHRERGWFVMPTVPTCLEQLLPIIQRASTPPLVAAVICAPLPRSIPEPMLETR